MPKCYTLEVRFAVHPHTDEHLRDTQVIRDEVASWLESLDAEILSVTVDELEEENR